MSIIKEIYSGDKLLSIIIRNSFEKEGIEFFTPESFSQQVGYMKRPKDYLIPPHTHNAIQRDILYTQEVLLIKSGKIRVDFYDDERSYLESSILQKGDVIILAYGGHGIIMLEDSEIIEVKQGPYAGEHDKVRFEPITKEKVVIKS